MAKNSRLRILVLHRFKSGLTQPGGPPQGGSADSSKTVLDEFGSPDFITFTNVFAHIGNLPELLDSLRLLITNKTVIVIENHYLGAILQTEQFDTYYHEHPRTYSHNSFKYIAKSLGLELLDAQYVSRYGGNIRVYLGNGEAKSIPGTDESKFKNQFYKLSEDIKKWKQVVTS